MDIKKEPGEDAEWRQYKQEFFDEGYLVKTEVDDAEVNFYSEEKGPSEASRLGSVIIKKEVDYIDEKRNIECVKVEETYEEEEQTNQKNTEISPVCSFGVPPHIAPYFNIQIDEIYVKKEHNISDTVDDAVSCLYKRCPRSNIPFFELVPLVKLRKHNFYAKNFVCGSCFGVFPTTIQLKAHEDNTCRTGKRETGDKKSNLKKYSCTKCDFQCSLLCDLQMHRNSHYGDKPFKCPDCSFVCKYLSKLRRHQISHTREKPFKCDECDFTCMHSGIMKKHRIVHTGGNPFKCEQCEYSCRQFKCLKVHKLIHSGEKPFKCDVCTHACRDASNLKKHKMIHSGEKPLKCDECDYSCIFSSNMKWHKMNHSGEKPFRCEKCDHAFTRSVHLKRHQSIHCRA